MQYRLVKLIVRNRVAVRVVQACFTGLFPGFVCCRLVEYSSSYGAYNKPASYGCLRQKRLIGQKHVTYLYQVAYRSELMRDEAYIRREGQGGGLGQGHTGQFTSSLRAVVCGFFTFSSVFSFSPFFSFRSLLQLGHVGCVSGPPVDGRGVALGRARRCRTAQLYTRFKPNRPESLNLQGFFENLCFFNVIDRGVNQT